MDTTTKGFALALFAVMLWAGNFVAARAIAFDIPPMHMNFYRWVVAFLCVVPFAVGPVRREWALLKRHLPYLALMGFVGVTCLNAFFYKAGSTTSSINMVLFVPSAPIIIMVLSRIFCGEPITTRRMLGLIIILVGLFSLISRGDWDNLLNFRISMGDLWSIAGVSSFGLYSFLSRYRPSAISATSFIASTFALGIVFCLPVLFWEMHTLPSFTWNTDVSIAVLYSGIGCSSIAYLAWAKAIDALGPVTAGMIYYSIPLFTALEGVLILGEQVTLLHVWGGGLMLFGIALATFCKKRVQG